MDRRNRGPAPRDSSPPPMSLPPLSLPLLSLLLLCTGGALCKPTQKFESNASGLPAEYKTRLQVLKLALALNEEWSPVWSEKLHSAAVAGRHPDPDFCMRLIPDGIDDGDGEDDGEAGNKGPKHAAEHHGGPVVDTYVIIRKIVDFCSFSGSYVRFGIDLLAASVQCLFHRHARFDLSAVSAMVEHANDGYHGYLRGLVADYMEIADKLAVVGAPLSHVVQLVTVYDDVDKRALKLARLADGGAKGVAKEVAKFHREVKDVAEKLRLRMDGEFDATCAVDEDNWYDKDRKEVVSLLEIEDKHAKQREKELKKKKKDKKNRSKGKKDKSKDGDEKEKNGEDGKKKEKKKDKKDEKGDDDGKKPKDEDGEDGKKDKKEKKEKDKHVDTPVTMLARANELRMLMRKSFERLLIREMPSQMWKEIFTNSILIKPDDIKSVPKKKAVESLKFKFDL